MNDMNPKVDHYLEVGCGRCPLGGTPDCKVHRWQEELRHLRAIVLDCGLTEEVKWSIPTYTFRQKNVLVIAAFNDYCALSFFKGALLKDAKGWLSKPGENTQSARVIKFTNVQEIVTLEPILKEYIFEAIELEKTGLNITFKNNPEPIPEELQNKLDEIPALKKAFNALTPGRQRGYILYFSAPKQSKTRYARIEKYTDKILNGEGFHDR